PRARRDRPDDLPVFSLASADVIRQDDPGAAMVRMGMAQTRSLDYHLPKRLLNAFFARSINGEDRPVFHDIAATAPTLAAVTASHPEIRAECERLLASRVPLPEYHTIDPGEAPISDTSDPGRWTVYVLEILGHRPEANRARCPATCRALSGVSDLVQAFF